MKLLHLLLFIVGLFSMKMQSQPKVFVDENMNEISSKVFYKKCRSEVYQCRRFEDSILTVNKVYENYVFGKLNPSELNQLRSLIVQQSHAKLNKQQTIILHFKDSLFGYYERAIIAIEQKNQIKISGLAQGKQLKFINQAHKMAKDRIAVHYSHITESNKKCKKLLERNYAKDFYIYNEDIGYLKEFRGEKVWLKNNPVLESLFFNRRNFAFLVIIKPTGDYILVSRSLFKNQFKELIHLEDWSEIKNDLKNSKERLRRNAEGFFRSTRIYADNDCIVEL